MTDQSTPAVLGLSEGLGPMPPLAARLRAKCSGYDEWRVQDPKDGAYCLAFSWPEVSNPERMAREWLSDHCRRFPGGLHTDFVVACVRVHTEADKLMLEAADEIDRLRIGHDSGALTAEHVQIEARCRKAFLLEDGYGVPSEHPERYRVFRDGFFAAWMRARADLGA